MRRLVTRVTVGLALALIAALPLTPVRGQQFTLPPECEELAFSTEEDFVTQGPTPPDGIPIISEGDLLGAGCKLCARNRELVGFFDVMVDLGLDAVDVINAERGLVAFSTELNSPNVGQFTAGDLLVTNGVIIPNGHLTYLFNVGYDIGLDGVHFVGTVENISALLIELEGMLPRVPPPSAFVGMLRQHEVDIWFSTEETFTPEEPPGFLDGDLLSAGNGTIVLDNSVLLPPAVPAGIPDRGVDFGLDAVTTDRAGQRETIRFSTEILFDGEPDFTDGDVLMVGVGLQFLHWDLIKCWEPKAKFLGLDALHMAIAGPTRVLNLPLSLRDYPVVP